MDKRTTLLGGTLVFVIGGNGVVCSESAYKATRCHSPQDYYLSAEERKKYSHQPRYYEGVTGS